MLVKGIPLNIPVTLKIGGQICPMKFYESRNGLRVAIPSHAPRLYWSTTDLTTQTAAFESADGCNTTDAEKAEAICNMASHITTDAEKVEAICNMASHITSIEKITEAVARLANLRDLIRKAVAETGGGR
jgi:hypothetical protein